MIYLYVQTFFGKKINCVVGRIKQLRQKQLLFCSIPESYYFCLHLHENPDGGCRCTTCNQLFKSRTTARQHIRICHIPPEFYECCLCKKVLKSKIMFRSHVYSAHEIRGRDIVNSYGQRVHPPQQ